MIIFSLKKNIKTYGIINSNVVKDDLVEAIVTDKELKTVYNNKYLYLDRRKYLIKIEKINRSVLIRKNKKYHNILLRVKLNNQEKVNDIKTLVLFQKKVNVFDMIKIIWKGV